MNNDSLKLSGRYQVTTIPAVGPFIEVPPAFQLSVETVPPATNQPVPAKYDSEKTADLLKSIDGCGRICTETAHELANQLAACDAELAHTCSQASLQKCIKVLAECMEERQILFYRNVELHASLAECRAEIARLTKERRTKDSERIDTLENIVRRVEAERDEAKDKLAANAENAAIR